VFKKSLPEIRQAFFELPSPMAELTLLWDTFEYVFEADRRRMGRIKPVRTYRNPVILAVEWKKMLDSGEYASQTALAQKIGVSRARVNQMLRLLKLPSEIQESVIQMGELSSPRDVTERRLRKLLSSSQG
jgi:hypothetical protein